MVKWIFLGHYLVWNFLVGSAIDVSVVNFSHARVVPFDIPGPNEIDHDAEPAESEQAPPPTHQ